jgi:hypothetical protein
MDYLDVLYDYGMLLAEKYQPKSDYGTLSRLLSKIEQWEKVAEERGLIVDE